MVNTEFLAFFASKSAGMVFGLDEIVNGTIDVLASPSHVSSFVILSASVSATKPTASRVEATRSRKTFPRSIGD